ncbi:GspE/PulE family protein [Jonesia denitrificans]|uniref:Type II secretion system protein E n=1 Tax=Jonesia denitrificans (strain ATCC 14870 / DSM 20603 / BCRC 15368 / CIP 55.134 / JCM 11481 / NBRC 15587 / NCTC 10816 / Prevot 55134) TaxID=471856 RepID=C7R4E6_JONDD|nr:ATPase, T2SS/T4P/T4SS family [Jonesia denitrificans]ACV09003.1 type II secretion system protein E [Jonesia denitrificans DSM 20603]ASE09701.1 type II secretion system protein GspE [Jonesia denitrificans]QXB44241.1 Flp pilus assembly complex ATPase component TadA [Jonesia denitrificans]SQH21108.1 Type II traffic warden ATPase [Jonesia denitrificans]
MKQLGEILLEEGLVTEDELLRALDEQIARGTSLGRVLVELGVLTENQLVAALAQQVGMRFVDLDDYAVDRAAVVKVPGPVCQRYNVLPIAIDNGQLILAMADPGNVLAIDDVRQVAQMPVQPVVSTHENLARALQRYIRADGEMDDLAHALSEEQEEEIDLSALGDSVEDDAPIVRYVNLVVTQAITDRASDIHIEPTEHDLRVRYRIDGVLHEMQRSPKSTQNAVTSRVKILADIDIAERRKPQDGRMSVNHKGRKIDLRVATLPTVWGEKIVMRILDNSTASLDLRDLSFGEANLEIYKESYNKPYGMILVTGPTGSGKSTTLYATLNAVSKPEINVITVEDPVEYRLPGINQVQVNPKSGLTFAAALRSILRSDPDVVLLGEIRDHETAQIAIEAALTGHLVLSTLHTNDAPSAVTRLTEMGIEPFLVGSALDCVVAQRLARKLCDKCKEPYQPSEREMIAAKFPWVPGEEIPTLYRPGGCATCSRTGYRGRLALHEVMQVNEDIERLAVARSSAAEISSTAQKNGMYTLREDGWMKVVEGKTSIEEVLRVVA